MFEIKMRQRYANERKTVKKYLIKPVGIDSLEKQLNMDMSLFCILANTRKIIMKEIVTKYITDLRSQFCPRHFLDNDFMWNYSPRELNLETV